MSHILQAFREYDFLELRDPERQKKSASYTKHFQQVQIYKISLHAFNIGTCLIYSRRAACPPAKDEKSEGINNILNYGTRKKTGSCYLDHQTKPSYREVKSKYNFFMIIKNKVILKNGTYPEPLEIDYPIIKHYSIGKPSPQILSISCIPSINTICLLSIFIRYTVVDTT